jgi:hypothetical protein
MRYEIAFEDLIAGGYITVNVEASSVTSAKIRARIEAERLAGHARLGLRTATWAIDREAAR